MRHNFFHVANTALTQETALHWLALRMVPGLGTLGTIKLLRKLKSPVQIFRSSATELEAAGLSPSQARNVASGCSFEDAVEQQQKMMAAGARLIAIDDPLYPKRLREIFDPPLLLFALGGTDLLDSYGIAIVGTRTPTPYGLAASERLSADLSKAGLTIVSGMARGVDTAAHRATLDANGSTIAVFAAASMFSIHPVTGNSTMTSRSADLWYLNSPWAPLPSRRISRFETGSSAACRLAL